MKWTFKDQLLVVGLALAASLFWDVRVIEPPLLTIGSFARVPE
jgi:hypothetical protein